MKCRICENSEGLETYEVREMMFGTRDLFAYIRCPSCGCLQIAEIPKDMSRYYPSEYYSFNMPVSEVPSVKSFLKKKRDRYAVSGRGFSGKMLNIFFPPDLIKLYTGMPFNYKILDVGCGTGMLIWRLKEAGFSNVTGIDPFNSVVIKYKNGLIIENKALSDINGSWDLITWHHSFEHVADPLKELVKTSYLLSENGRCIIRTPVIDSWAWENYKTDWVQIDAPRHFYLHSVKSMETLAEKTGLSVEKVEYDSTAFQFWGSEQYRKDMSLNDERSYYVKPRRSEFNKKAILQYKRKAKNLNIQGRGDQAIFFFQKHKIG